MKVKTQYLMAGLLMAGIATAFAASVHLKRGTVLADQGLTLQACGALAGLGNGDVTITLVANGSIDTICTSPGGGSAAPGQNPADAVVLGDVTIPANQIKNGTVKFCVSTEVPETPSPDEVGCPNPNWTVSISNVTFSDAILIVEQGGKVVLTQPLQ